jgi:hypothetical protein
MKRTKPPATSFEVQGNRGGSYVRITSIDNGMVHLEVGETCVVTVDQEISVAALAAVLTSAKDNDFQNVVDEYLSRGGGSPEIRVEHDLPTSGKANTK